LKSLKIIWKAFLNLKETLRLQQKWRRTYQTAKAVFAVCLVRASGERRISMNATI